MRSDDLCCDRALRDLDGTEHDMLGKLLVSFANPAKPYGTPAPAGQGSGGRSGQGAGAPQSRLSGGFERQGRLPSMGSGLQGSRGSQGRSASAGVRFGGGPGGGGSRGFAAGAARAPGVICPHALQLHCVSW